MMTLRDQSDTNDLAARAADGDQSAVRELLDRHRSRLRRMVAVRMDPRLVARVDPSDIVQETLTEAAKRLPERKCDERVSFYPWLRKLAWQRLVKAHRYHIAAQRRSIDREEDPQIDISDESVLELADRFGASQSSPSKRMMREEMKQRVRSILQELPPAEREVLVLKYLEQLTLKEISEIMGISEAAVKMRHARGIDRLYAALTGQATGQ